MKKQMIKVNGIEYKYIITENNTLRFDGIVPYKTYQIIKERLIKQGKYQEKKSMKEDRLFHILLHLNQK